MNQKKYHSMNGKNQVPLTQTRSDTSSSKSSDSPDRSSSDGSSKKSSDVLDGSSSAGSPKSSYYRSLHVSETEENNNKYVGWARKKSHWVLLVAMMLFFAVIIAVVVIYAGVNITTSRSNNTNNISQAPSPKPSPSPTNQPSPGPSSEPSLGPTPSPSASPSDPPTTSPSAPPSTTSSTTPSATPSFEPSTQPSDSPSEELSEVPTVSPTNLPTPKVLYVQPNKVPANPEPGYFNYDPSSEYGPKNWHRVNTRNHWLNEFGYNGFGPWGGHFNESLTNNICNGRPRKQSPKNLVETEACEATHEIRTECATDALTDGDAFEKQILPHKLSIVSRRRPCLNVEEDGRGRDYCVGDRPPMVDYPKYAASGSAYSDMHHIDFKIPGEHTFQGERFDAEIQMFNMHLSIDRLSSIAVPIRAKPRSYNKEFQWILNSFQEVYDQHKKECEASRRNLRQQQQLVQPQNSTFTNITDARKLQDIHRKKFNPYSDALMPGMFFYRYDGSITEPPCRDITWWVMNEPAIIDQGQLNQLKKILFTHVDSSCKPTSVHNEDQSVVRPIQKLGEDRVIQYCPSGSFRSDTEKGRKPAKQCRW